MIGVIFEWDKNVTDKEGRPIRKIYMAPHKMYGVKHNGVRPKTAYVFNTNVFEEPDYTDENIHAWFFKPLVKTLYPTGDILKQITFQDNELQKYFGL